MLLNRAIQSPRASAEYTTRTWEEVMKQYRAIFLGGEDIGSGISSAENLSPVAAAHRILCNGYALIPFEVYQKDGDARRSVKDDHLARVLKHRPNPNASPFNLRHTQMSNAYWWGWGAIWNVRDDHGAVIERYALPSDCGSIRRDPETGNYWYDFNVDGVSRTFASYELSILLFESYDGIHGRGMIHLAREAIASDGMAQRYQKKFYQNGARLSGIVHVDTDASKDTRERVRKSFSRYASDDAFKVAVLDHGMTFTPMGVSQSDAQYIESRGFTVEEIARFTGVPKYMMQTGKEAYNSNQQQRVDFVTDTLAIKHAASSATLAISACDEIQCESGALCCYHNPTSYASGDHNDMAHAAESLRNARDCIIEVYRARKSVKSAEELAELMDKDIFITPTQAMEYGLIDKIVW